MALPVTISGVEVGNQNSYHGPFKSSGGAFYTILFESTDKEPEAWKATDPTTSFAEQDAANSPNFSSGDTLTLNAHQAVDKLHIVSQNSIEDVYYARFAMASDTWDAIDGASDRDILIDGAPDGTTDACDLVVRSDGDIAAVYQKAVDKVMGNPYERVGLSVSTSANRGETWSAVVRVDNQGSVERSMTGPRIVLGDSDASHIVWKDNNSPATMSQRTLRASDDALLTERTDVTGAEDLPNVAYPIGHGVSFDRGGTTRIRFPYQDVNQREDVLEFDAAADPSTFTQADDIDGTNSNRSTNNSLVGCLAVDGSTVHFMFARATDADLYFADDADSDTWTTPAKTTNGTGTFNHVSSRTYDRSGTKLAFIVDDGGTVKYDEESIVGAPPSGTGAQILPALTMAGVGLMHPSGVGAQNLAALTMAGVGKEKFVGSGAQLLAAMTQSGISVMLPSGGGAQTFPAMVQSGAGVHAFKGAGAQTFAALLQAGVAAQVFAATGAQSFAALLQNGVGLEDPSGTGVQTFAALIQSGGAVQVFVGTGAQVLAALVQAGIGLMHPSGTATQILAALTQAGVGLAGETTGTGAQALAALIQAGVGLMHPSGSGAQALAALIQSGLGAEKFVATGAQLLPGLTQAGVGVMLPSGAGAQTLAALLQNGAGVLIFTATGAQALPALVQSGAGLLTFTATGAQTFATLTQNGVGLLRPSGAGAQTLAGLIQAGVGVEKIIGAGSQAFAALLQAGVGTGGIVTTGSGAQLLAALTQAGVGVPVYTGVSAQLLAALIQSGIGLLQPSGAGVQIFAALTMSGVAIEIFPVILRDATLTGRQAVNTLTGIQPAHDLKGRQSSLTGTGKI